MAAQSFLIQVNSNADEQALEEYIREAVAGWHKSYPLEGDEFTDVNMESIRVTPVEVCIRKKEQ